MTASDAGDAGDADTDGDGASDSRTRQDSGNGGDSVSSEDQAVVFDLAPDCTLEDVEEDELYLATVNGVVEYGVFVDLSQHVSGLVHETNLHGAYEVGDDIVVELERIRDDGDLAFVERELEEYETVDVAPGTEVAVADLGQQVGDTVHLEGEVVQIKQTGGPTLFHVSDGAGVVPCAAFDEAGKRAYPNVEIDDAVRITGNVETHDDALQVEVEGVVRLRGEAAREVHEQVADRRADRAEPAHVDPLVEWPAMEPLLEDLRAVARRLREAVLTNRPVRMRHHADGDGMCAAVPVELALEGFISNTHEDSAAPRHLFKRLPSKAPFYEMEDVTRDLNFALEDRDRHGQRLPLLLMLDNGSTEEDTPAYRALDQYDVPVVVVDHHHPDPEAVGPLVAEHVNPYLHGEDYRITTGMLCVELARMIDPSLTDDLGHIPAVAGLADRSSADTMANYLQLANDAGYGEDDVRAIGEALDYAAHWLRYNAGRNLVNDIIDVGCDDDDRHRNLVEFLSTRAERDVQRQLEATLPHLEEERLDNGVRLHRIDVENFAHRFTYPAPGKTTGKIHDHMVAETGNPVITIGYGPDFVVLRSDGVRLDIPTMVSELSEEIEGAGVSGGGHLVVGSLKFVKGMREEVVDALVGKMADAELDADLGSSVVRNPKPGTTDETETLSGPDTGSE